MIYLDMDGVVADFNSFVSALLNREIGWEGRDLSDDEWAVLASYPRLYFHLSVIPEGRKLVELAKSLSPDVKFLTAIPRRTTIETAEKDKREWLSLHFPGVPMEIGPHSKDKQLWCKPGDILVDDKKSNVEEWYSKQGIAIHHLGNWERTLNNLKEAVKIRHPIILN